MNVRLILDEPAPGAWNMAVDEALLDAVASGAPPTLRVYRWSEPTLSLGYFQDFAERDRHPPSRRCPVVRRSSGGGAILHDREWTYSFAAPIADRLSGNVLHLYNAAHGALVEVLNMAGLPAKMWESATDAPREEPFLCFQRRAVGDVVVGDYKVCGSAQRRRRQAVMQHGSVLLERSPAAPELLGIKDFGSSDRDMDGLQEAWLHAVAQALAVNLTIGVLHQEELAAAKCLAGKHRQGSWLERR